MAGPCSVESAGTGHERGQVRSRPPGRACCAAAPSSRGLRPYAFQGHGEEALRWMRAAADECGLAVISEIMDARPSR